MDPFLENQKSAEEEIIKEQFDIWNRLLEKNANTGIAPEIGDKEWEFAIDRRQDVDSRFTVDAIDIYRLTGRLENYIGDNSLGLISQEKEKWIIIEVRPQDPYRSKIASFKEGKNTHYLSELLHIYLSSQGRGFEETIWGAVLSPDIHDKQISMISSLKEFPKIEDTIELSADPYKDEIIEHFQTLSGQSIERLHYLHRAVETGNILYE